jgi:septum formation protein
MKNNIILASSSPYRKTLLEKLNLSFQSISPDIDEDSFKKNISDPILLAQKLAYEKANKIAQKYQNSIVIGSDQILTIDHKVLGKTNNIQKSLEQLQYLRGKTHQLITAVCVISPVKKIEFYDSTLLSMKELTDQQLKNYLSLDNPIDCAGSYKLEEKGIGLFSRIESKDHTAIIGLPLIELSLALEKLGVETL